MQVTFHVAMIVNVLCITCTAVASIYTKHVTYLDTSLVSASSACTCISANNVLTHVHSSIGSGNKGAMAPPEFKDSP